MLDQIIGCLACPHCGEELRRDVDTLRCENGHAFDVARQGYVNLLPGNAKASTADTAEMVEARAEFLGRGHFDAVADAVSDMSVDALAGAGVLQPCIVDAGAGTGFYLARVLDRVPMARGIALDLSKQACRKAAADERIGAAVADTWSALPLRAGCASLLLDVFAPRSAAEFHRVLAPGGALLVVTPLPDHLAPLVDELRLVTVDPEKDARIDRQLSGRFALERRTVVSEQLELGREDIRLLVRMGPSARHLDESGLEERLGALPDPVSVDIRVHVALYRRMPRG